MGIEGIDKMVPDKDEPVPKTAQICKCGHSLARHVLYNSSKSLVCIERFCHCSSFKLNHIL